MDPMRKILGVLAVLASLTGCSPTPAPVDTDAAFLTAWHDNFPNSDDEKAKNVGHGVCDAYNAGTTFLDEVTYLRTLAPQLTARQAGAIVGASTAAYCPEFNNRH